MLRQPKPLPPTKVCSKCKIEKSASSFRKREKTSVLGVKYFTFESACLACENKRNTTRTVVAGMPRNEYNRQPLPKTALKGSRLI